LAIDWEIGGGVGEVWRLRGGARSGNNFRCKMAVGGVARTKGRKDSVISGEPYIFQFRKRGGSGGR